MMTIGVLGRVDYNGHFAPILSSGILRSMVYDKCELLMFE